MISPAARPLRRRGMPLLAADFSVASSKPSCGFASVGRSASTRACSSGADIACFAASMRRGQAVALREFVRRGQRLTGRIETLPKPIIAAVNGLAHGGGCEIAEAAPLAIASDHAEFCKAEI